MFVSMCCSNLQGPIQLPKELPAKAIVTKARNPNLFDKSQLKLTVSRPLQPPSWPAPCVCLHVCVLIISGSVTPTNDTTSQSYSHPESNTKSIWPITIKIKCEYKVTCLLAPRNCQYSLSCQFWRWVFLTQKCINVGPNKQAQINRLVHIKTCPTVKNKV